MRRAILALVPLLALAGCGQAADDAAAPEGKPGLEVSEGRLVLPAVEGNPAAAYFALKNGGDDVAGLAAVHIDGAQKAEMHDSSGGTMSPLVSPEIRPGETMRFAPGGKHVMAFDLEARLVAGGVTEMTLTFADGDKLSAPLKIEAVGGASHGEPH